MHSTDSVCKIRKYFANYQIFQHKMFKNRRF